MRTRRIHPAWFVAIVGFITLVSAAGFRAGPSVLMLPLEAEFGWSLTQISFAVTLNLLLYGLTAPFAAALMAKFGIRRVAPIALGMVSLGSALSVLATAPWMLWLTWGLLIGVGTGSMASVFAATIANTWFVKRRGLVVGILTAGSATGQLVFLPIMANLVDAVSWRSAALLIAACALAVVPLVLIFIRSSPADIGTKPYGAPDDWVRPAPPTGNPARAALEALKLASRSRAFWALAIAFAVCGFTTNGMIGTHFIPSAHDHGMTETTAAGLLAVVGVFDILGTIASGWLTDRVNPRILLAIYYTSRGIALMLLPVLLGPNVQLPLLLFIVLYGLDWVATVPPTVALCREKFGSRGTVVYGWVFTAHQIGAAAGALGAGMVREQLGSYTLAWMGGAALCALAVVVSLGLRKGLAPNFSH
ncbi:MAG: MFS transporter [Microbacteriaceae bacterium]